MTLDEAIAATGGTAEGVKSSRSVLELATTLGVEMPITSAVVQVLHEGLPVEQLAALLLAPARTRPKALCERRPRAAGARLQVAPEVLDVLDADRQPQQVLRHGDATRSANRRRRSRVDSTPPRLVAGTQSRRARDDGVRRVGAAVRAQADDRAEAVHLRARRARGPGRRAGSGAGPRATAGCSASRRASSAAFALRALDPQRERAQPAQREPHLERSGDRRRAACGARAAGRAGRRRRPAAAPSTTSRVPGEVLGHGVHDDVGAELERALHQRRRERVVDADERARRVRGLDERGQVGDLEHRVGRRLDPEQRRRRRASAATTAAVSSMSTSATSMPSRCLRGPARSPRVTW